MMKVKVKVTQSCPTLCDLMDYTVHYAISTNMLTRPQTSFELIVYKTVESRIPEFSLWIQASAAL